MMPNSKSEQFADEILDTPNSWITEFKNFTAIDANQVVMLSEAKRFFINRLAGSKLVSLDQITIDQ